MGFNTSSIKQDHEIFFSRKSWQIIQSTLAFNSKPVQQITSRKDLGLTLDPK